MTTKAAVAAAANEDSKQVTFEPNVAVAPIPRRHERCTEETSSDAPSNRSSDGHYELIEYDFAHESAGRGSSDLFHDVGTLSIQDDSPAAAALRANAGVHVSSMGKAARAVHMQSVRRVLKRATGKHKSGNKKGKPPRVPPKIIASPESYSHAEEDEEEDEDASESASSKSQFSGLPLKQAQDDDNDGGLYLDVMDESGNSKIKEQHAAATASEKQTQLDRDTMHMPDGVAPGTVEAGKKGTCGVISRPLIVPFARGTLTIFSCVFVPALFVQFCARSTLTTCSNWSDGNEKRRVF